MQGGSCASTCPPARTRVIPTSDYADRFIGGRGIANGLYWDNVPPETGALDADNCLVFATGPLAGVPVIGGSRWYVSAKSPMTSPEHMSYCNLGGDWGARLKSAGYDAVFVRGRAEKPVYLLVEEQSSGLKDASWLWGKGGIQARELLKGDLGDSISVAAIGQAGENRASMACLIATDDAAGGGGMGAVMGSKNLKAIVVRGARRRTTPARPEALEGLTREFRRLFTPHPTLKIGSVPLEVTGPGTAKAPCWLCMGDCIRRTYQAQDGRKGKFMCQPASFYHPWVERHHGPGHEAAFHAAKVCDEYGVDVTAMVLIIVWLLACVRQGILTEDAIGLPVSRVGSLEFIEALVRKISLREGFGDVLAAGVERAAEQVGPQALSLLMPLMCKAGWTNVVEGRLYPNTALMAALDPKAPLGHTHEVKQLVLRWLDWRRGVSGSYVSNEVFHRITRRCWGSEEVADLGNHEAMARATVMIQDRQYAHDCLVVCGFMWPITDSQFTPDHLGDLSLESSILSAVTGRDIDEEGLNRAGETVFNLNRAILVREGHRGVEDDRLPEAWHSIPLKIDMTNPEMILPGKGDEIVCLKGKVVDRDEFAGTRRAYYGMRHWNEGTGLQTVAGLQDLGLADVASDLKRRGLAA